MKTTSIYPANNSFLFLIAFMLIISVSSCATKMHFLNSPVVPAAEGVVKVDKDKNKNYDIKVQVYNLAEPSKLQPAKNYYVVWVEDVNNETKNIGKIKITTDLLTKRLKGSIQTVSPTKPRIVFITAENDERIEYTNYSDVILTTENFRK